MFLAVFARMSWVVPGLLAAIFEND
ncbi:MAG: hypothetical protein JWR50_4365, partial [Mucilaginibacter sp.]|nr:hypothetical protein [Mucilaginibacter sp.]